MAFGFAAYGVWMGDNGMFADVVARVAKASNDMTVDRVYKGDLDTVAASLSGEFGWRFDVAKGLWVEPQFEAAYTHAGADTVHLTNGANSASYEIGDFNSLIGRAGLAAGLTCRTTAAKPGSTHPPCMNSWAIRKSRAAPATQPPR